MALDLGGLAFGLATTYISTKYGKTPGTGMIGGSAPVAQQQMDVEGIPFIDVIPEPSCGGKLLWDPRANCGAGKWITKRRRRHRNLATRGDIRDLSALKGVIGQGKLLEAWIATHS